MMMDPEIQRQFEVDELAEAQKRTEESLRRLIDRSGNGHGS
jgi:hypothetical protein